MIHLLTKKVSNTSRKWLLTLCLIAACASSMYACSILYYVDKETGTIYAVNNEDFWLDTDAYIQIEKATSKKLAR
ncbi:hypothetical protein MED134_12606 [Dokdonia sp. MED134]|nr:hypothetical protein [Dokdonia sp. MED134]EAQ38010.2 hypothetical protein MED134_12606 [Dokdonia sp. MED134]